MQKKKPSLDEAIVKARTYCNYRDRSHKELKNKLYQLGLWKQEVDQVILQMIEEDLLNEERYALSYARGYFRTKQWGKYKIKMGLRQQSIHERLIEKALKEIEPAEYIETIKAIIAKKDRQWSDLRKPQRKQKISNYLTSRGFEYRDFNQPLAEVFGK